MDLEERKIVEQLKRKESQNDAMRKIIAHLEQNSLIIKQKQKSKNKLFSKLLSRLFKTQL